MEGLVRTVLGDVEPGSLGLTLPHEHLLVRVEGWAIPPRDEEQARFARAPMSLELLARVHRRALSNLDNCRIDQPAVVEAELRLFAEAGGGALTDLTPPALGRDPASVRELSRSTGVRVVMGCGYYVQAAHPPELESMTEEQIADELERELTEGIGDTGVRAGVIGEIGTGNPVTPGERKVLRAAVRAQRATGAPLTIHLFPAGGTATEVLDLVEAAGAGPSRVVLCHRDENDPIDVDECIRLARRGAYVEFDVFGANWTSDDLRDLDAGTRYWSQPPSDQQRVRAIAQLFDAGVGDRVLISHDVCTKTQQVAWGGPGFVHIPQYMVPFFKPNGFGDDEIQTLVVRNPQRWLAWTGPAG